RESLLGLLREFESIGRGRVQTRVIPTEANTDAAREAERAYGIKARNVPSDEGGIGATMPVFLGVAVAGGAGPDAAVVPFLSRGLNAEYELARAIRSAGVSARKRIGVLETQAGLFGSFDFQSMSPGRDWPILSELRKQYTVERVALGVDVPAEVDVLLVAQPSTLNNEQLQKVVSYVKAGRAAVILEDPFPLVNPQLATNEPRQRANPMMGGPAPEPKADLAPLYEALGARVNGGAVVWDTFNPHPQLAETQPEFIWVARRPGGDVTPPFAEDNPITSGLQECVLLFTGPVERVERSGEAAAGMPEFIPLLRTAPGGGQVPYASIMSRNMFGMGQLNPQRRPVRVTQSQVLAAQVRGGADKVNAVLIGDLDMISETFFTIREQGFAGLEFDNVTFILNAVDALAGDSSLLDLRKKRRQFRTLEVLEKRRQAELQATREAELAAQAEAESRLEEAQARLNAKVKEVEERKDLDDTTRRILVESTRAAEQRRLTVQQASIEDQQRQRIEDARLETKRQIDTIQMTIRTAAVALPPVPALAVGIIVFARRRAMDAAGRSGGRSEASR
ncbi:MAG: Gldg family protein, partial [Phycisphaeraceae bacterium]|nr:Gldg family protein [Phycisphaeraceae bacterium]